MVPLQVSPFHALFTRVTGPGMIHPSITAALDDHPAPVMGQEPKEQDDAFNADYPWYVICKCFYYCPPPNKKNTEKYK